MMDMVTISQNLKNLLNAARDDFKLRPAMFTIQMDKEYVPVYMEVIFLYDEGLDPLFSLEWSIESGWFVLEASFDLPEVGGKSGTFDFTQSKHEFRVLIEEIMYEYLHSKQFEC